MPKWGISMSEGRIAEWLVTEGDQTAPGDEIVEVETDKIVASVETQQGGVLRRRVAQEGEVLPVGALLAVLADPDTADSEIDSFVLDFEAHPVVEQRDEAASADATETVTVGDRTIRFLRSGGEGEPIILVHGFGGNLNNWLFNREALADGREVYAFDLPGHGGTSKDVGKGSTDDFAEVLKGFMEVLEIGQAHLVGHSLGGAVALTFALAEPGRTASLTLIASVGLGAEINASYIDGFARARRRKELKSQVARLFSDPSLVTRQMLEDILRFKRLDGVQNALQTIADQLVAGGIQRVALADRLEELAAPLLVIWGEDDEIIPCSHTQAVTDRARTAVIPGAGHMVQMEATAEVNRLILELVNSA